MKRVRLTIRGRLTLVYGGLFMLAGMVLLGVTYVLVSQRSAAGTLSNSGAPGLAPPSPRPGGPLPSGGETPSVNADVIEDVRQDTVNAVLTQGGIALLVVGLAAIAIGWLIAGQLLQPLHRVTETARRIAEAQGDQVRGLHERIALDGPDDEVKELADTFDVMLARLDRSVEAQRRFIANASHELRTPLTLNRTLLDVAVRRPDAPPEVRQLGETLLDINARHERLIDGLLLLARTDRELTERSYLDLADIVDHVVTRTHAGSITIHSDAAEAPTAGNPVLLERLVENLVENAVRYNVADSGWVRIRSGVEPDGSAVLEVSNTGPVVPPYVVPTLFEPFRRFHDERHAGAPPGAGLGLSIVQAVADAHGGVVHAVPRTGGGLVVTVVLPAASDDAGMTSTSVESSRARRPASREATAGVASEEASTISSARDGPGVDGLAGDERSSGNPGTRQSR